MKLSSDREHLVLDNQKLVYYLVHKLGITQNSSKYEDIVSIGTIGLIKAAITFDPSKEITFSTYALTCIRNEIFMYYRKTNKYANDISIDEPIIDNGEGNELTIGDTIAHPESNFFEKIVNTEDFIQLMNIILNYLDKRMRLVMLYRIGDMLQQDVAKKLRLSQSVISRIETKATIKIRKFVNHPVDYKEVFSMAIVENEYRISFSSKDINRFSKIFATLLQNLTTTENLPDFRVNCNKERVVIQIPAHPESFSFIAQIIQEIDDWSMTFVSNKSTLPANSDVSQKVEANDKAKISDTAGDVATSTIEQENCDTDTIVEDTASTVKRSNMLKQVKDYMLSMSSFSIKDLKHHFPDLATTTIYNVVYDAKNKGLITTTGRGKYRVNET